MTRLRRTILVCVVVVAATAAALSTNLLLLARTSDQRGPVVLTRHVELPSAPIWTVRSSRGPIGDRGADD